MTAYTATTALASRPAKTGPAGVKLTGVGTVVLGAYNGTATVTTGPKALDVYNMVRLPAGAIITGGVFRCSRWASGTSFVSTSASLQIGLSGAFKDTLGTSYGSTTATAALASTWVMEFEVVSLGGVKGESGFIQHLGGLLISLGQLRLTDEQWATITLGTSGTSFISGSQFTLEVDYYMPIDG